MGAFVGIDLGTTYSAVAYVNSVGKPEVIPNDRGETLTPSVVDLSCDPPLVGLDAKERQSFGGSGVYAFFKRQMGNRDALFIEGGEHYTPTDLSAYLLAYLKRCAEIYLRQAITDAVITVPAYFRDPHRRATIQAGEKAGFNVLRVISEPTAAALAYGLRPSDRDAIYLVYDLGGGTFDVSLVRITPTELRVLGTDGDRELGGKDWDDRLIQYLASVFEREHGVELIGDDANELLFAVEQAKRDLSSRLVVGINIQGGGRSGRYELTRAKFEELTSDLLEQTTSLCEYALAEQKLNWGNLEGVILVGGSTRMPAVRHYVEKMSGKPPLGGIHPDEAVALGAAIQAAMDVEARTGSLLTISGRKTTVDVISASMGMIAVNDDYTRYINSIIISKNKPIPCSETRPYQLRVRRDGESKLEVFMTQGETQDPRDCIYLGLYVFSDVPPVESKVAVIDISYAYNPSGVVEVSARERSTGKPLTLTVESLPFDVPDRFMLPPVNEALREHLNIYMAFDLSGSMEGEPLAEAKKAALKFVSECDLSSTSIGIIEFSDRSVISVKGSQDAKRICRGIEDMRIGRTGICNGADPFNDIYDGLHKAKGQRYGLVLADGVWAHQDRAERLAKRCHKEGIEIIAIGFGGADEAFLRRISSSDDLSFFTNLSDLSETFSSIAQELTEGAGRLTAEGVQKRRGLLRD